jgi:small-conductance mechanosensitive channel
VRVRISFDSDVRKALDLMIQGTHQPARVLRHPEPKALLLGIGDSALDLELRFWICDVQNGIRNVSSEVLLEIWDLFRQHDIHVPFPQRDIHLHPAQHPSMTTRHPPEATVAPRAAE